MKGRDCKSGACNASASIGSASRMVRRKAAWAWWPIVARTVVSRVGVRVRTIE